MTPDRSCPNCGARVQFRWSGAVQTTCPYCRSILVRHDVDLERVGEVADLPQTPSPIQIGTGGRWEDDAFQVVGRIVYEYERGGWNEWHCVTHRGESIWLADAQLEYALSVLVPGRPRLPDERAVHVGQTLELEGRRYRVQRVTPARYRGVEGELPFEYWDKGTVTFADLASTDGHFGTIDYSEPSPLLFLGRNVEFGELRLTGLREFEGW